MMENIYSRRVLNFKNKYGSSLCAIAQEKSTGTVIMPKGIDISKTYIVTKNGQFTEGSKIKDGWIFPEKMDNISAVILGEFDNEGNLKPYAHTAFTGEAFEIKRNGFSEKAAQKEYIAPEKNTEALNENTEALKESKEEITQGKSHSEEKTTEKDQNSYQPIASKEHKNQEVQPEEDILAQYEKAKNDNWAEKRLKSIIKTFEKEMKELESIGVIKKEDLEQIEMEGGKKGLKGIDKLFGEKEKIYPFENDDYDWIAISSNEIWRAGIKEKKAVQNPLVMAGEIKYNHLALGRNRHTGGLIFAVPEKFDPRDKKEAFDAGFKDFWYCRRDKNDFGYWVMAI